MVGGLSEGSRGGQTFPDLGSGKPDDNRRMKRYRHKPVEVEAVQVVKPFRAFKAAFPRHHEFKLPSGRISAFHLVDAEPPRTKAYPGDWVLKIPQEGGPAKVEILTEAEFNRRYEDVD